jgi:hypothetical protein
MDTLAIGFQWFQRELGVKAGVEFVRKVRE